MKKNRRIIFWASILSAAFLASSPVFAYETMPDNDIIDITAHGEKIDFSEAPFAKDGEIYIPIREFLDQISGKIEIIWNSDRSVILNGYCTDSADEQQPTQAKFAIDSKVCDITRGAKSKQITLENPPILKNGKTYITFEMAGQLEKELSMTGGFEASVPGTDRELLNNAVVWADSLKTRDGKPRYEIMTEDMKNKFIENQKALVNSDDWNYVIGVSSPWIISYDAIVQNNNAYITYFLTDSTNERYSFSETVAFEKSNDKYVVSNATEHHPRPCAFLKSINGNKITFDFAEYITYDDKDRMAELNLTESDMPDGYYIYNPEEDTEEYLLTDDTVYNIIDWQRMFVKDESNIKYTTTKLDEFKQYIQSYDNSQPKMPFFVELDGENVISITEEPMA